MKKIIWVMIYILELIAIILYYTLKPPQGNQYLIPSYIGRGIFLIMFPTAIIHYTLSKKPKEKTK